MTQLTDRHQTNERAADRAARPVGESLQDGLAAEATRLLYERHRQRIFAFCLNRLGNRHEADDAVQTTFLYAFRSLQRGVVPKNEAPWLFTIAANACRTRRRALWRRRRLEASVDPDTLHDVLGPADFDRDELAGLGAALASLPTNQRRALLLREWQGLSYREIGQALSLSQSAVETLLFRARRTLTRKLRHTVGQAALVLNGIPLLRLVRRLGQASAGTKTAATLVAVSVAASAGGPAIQRELRHQPARAPGAAGAELSNPRDTPVRSSHPAARGLQSADTYMAAVTSPAPGGGSLAVDKAGPGRSAVAGAARQPARITLPTDGRSPTPREPSRQRSAPATPVPRLPHLPSLPVVSIEAPALPQAAPPPPLPSTLADAGNLLPGAPTPGTPQVSAPPPPAQVPPIEGTPSLP